MDSGNNSQQKDFMQIYHPNCLLDDRSKALINDIIPLFTQVEIIEQEITFPLFKQLWKDYHLQYLTSSNSFQIQTVCIMGIYSIFSTQIESDRERINIDIESLIKLKTYIQNCLQRNQRQGADILKILFSKDAFIITQKRGIKSIILDKFGYPLKKNTFFEDESICGFSQMPQTMEIEQKDNNSDISEEDDEDNEEKEQIKENYTDPDQLIEYLGIKDLKEALGDYNKHKTKKKDIINKISENDLPFYDQTKKDFVGKFTHDLNQIDSFFVSRTETRIQRQLNQTNYGNN